MRIGDIIMLDKKIGEPVNVNIEGLPFFDGTPGRAGNAMATKIRHRLEQIEQERQIAELAKNTPSKMK